MKKFLFTFLAIIIVVAGYFLVSRNIVKVNTIPAGWLTYTGNGVEFNYPATFGANVWRAVTWPPTVITVPADKDPVAFGCPKLKDSAIITESGLGKINNIHYTFYQGEDVGAGQRYTSSCYIFSGTAVNYVVDFEIRSHLGCQNGECGAYCGTPFEQECRNFDLTRDVETTIVNIIRSLKEIKSN